MTRVQQLKTATWCAFQAAIRANNYSNISKNLSTFSIQCSKKGGVITELNDCDKQVIEVFLTEIADSLNILSFT